jgi:TolB-like protein/tRNA A-37 threonylcarbamoyl transferase component Bud32/Tfp pilus assembly protein PilF
MIGKTISHYRIIEELGRGGMGIVYKARDTKLGRTVALKFLSPAAIGGEEEKARFFHEAQAAAALSHPNICTIYEIDEYEECSFMAMECVEGKSLRSMIESGPMKLDQVVDIGMQMAVGLQEAHEKEVVHRDIKPANIMIMPKGRVKIMDFGLAKLRGQTMLTKEGTTLGTVSYMSPEQARGDEVDHRTDIWSLGVLLYEMITGRVPFHGEYEQAVIYSILNAEPDALTSLRTGVPMELERIVHKCLAKDARERYQSAADLSADLFHYKKGMSHKEPAAPVPSIKKPTTRRFRWMTWAFAAVVLVLLITQLLPRFFPSSEESPERRKADERTRLVVLPFENLGAPEDEYFADGITEEITSRLAAIHELGVISRKSALHYKDSDKTISEIGTELDVDYVLEGTVRWERSPNEGSRVRVTPQLIRVSDDSHIWAERYDEDFKAIFDVQTRIAEQVTAQLDIALSGGEQDFLKARPTENTVAYQLYLRAVDYIVFGHCPEVNYQRAEKLLEQAIDIDPGFALAHAKLSHVHRSFYFYGYDRTEERLGKSKEEIDLALELDPEAPEVRRELGYYYYQGLLDYDRALEVFMALAVTLPNDSQLLQDIAFIWRRQGHLEQALANLETAYSMSPMDAGLCVEVAHTNLCLRRAEEAIEYVDKAIVIDPQSHWSYFIKSAAYIFGMGDVQRALEASDASPEQAVMSTIWGRYFLYLLGRDYQAILDMLEDSSIDVIRMQSAYLPVSMLKGHACKFMGDNTRADVFYEEALEVLTAAARDNPEDPRIQSAMGSVYAGLGRKEEAIASGRKAVEIYPVTRDAILGVDRLMDLAQIYARVGEKEASIELIRQILSMPAIYTIYAFELDPRFDSLREEPAYKQLIREFSEKQS